jgi:LmbE family N-acetylglucosaminyl deacetylase
MKKVIYGIFAHPDDEAFGVSPTLIKESRGGTDVHLVTLTSGQNGMNPDNFDDLGAVRLEEWQRGGALMGAKSMHYLGYIDGQLCNEMIDEIVAQLTALVEATLAEEADTVIEFMAFDFTGISGHIDHIVASHAACLTFYRLKARYSERLTRLRLRCLPASHMPSPNVEWRYIHPGRPDAEIDEIIDAREYHDEIIAVIRAHHTQRHDGENHINRDGDTIGMNYFIVLE